MNDSMSIQGVPVASGSGAPLVSIGLPVFNGEAYVSDAIRSILTQTMADLELVICDNCSTDATQAICEAFAKADARVRYVRNPRNLGAGPNYDRCFHLARGTYFKWAAHDDMMAPDYLERAVAALEADPAAVLCTVGIREIGPDGETLRVFANEFPGVTSRSAAARFGGLIHTRHQCEDFFGLYRRSALIGSGLHDNYSGSDRVLLAEMALRGPWVSAPEPLFLHREHDKRYTRAVLLVDPRQAALWQDTSGRARQRNTMFHWGIYRRYWKLVNKSVASPVARLGCYAQLVAWWGTDGHAGDVTRDVVRTVSPGLFQRIRTAKRAVLGMSHAVRPGSLPPNVAGPTMPLGE
ncbi:glycosyltransferase family 2 protein [Lichenicoccus roseus]|uniref:Glycosyltransferase family 2 protein n=1 Tax=Lichenicoccus roseus TaxID=2683649 RepID=A0A5R9JBN8_9PROT|nr:glycosyltransferase family 2 protein [Lichenicoccus roseus]